MICLLVLGKMLYQLLSVNGKAKEKNKMSTVNEFFCGFYYLVCLADQAEACCQVWDSLCWGNQKV